MAPGCCGGGRKRTAPSPSPAPVATASARTPTIPLSSGSDAVKATFMDGNGQGKHCYRGPHTRWRYYARYGHTVNADRRDTCSQIEYNESRSRSRLIRVEQAAPPPPAPMPEEQEFFKPAPILVEPPPEIVIPPPPLPDHAMSKELLTQRIEEISSMTVRDIVIAAKAWSREVKDQYIIAEKAGDKKRISVAKVLGK